MAFSPTICPQLGVGGLMPMPMKLRPASAKMADGMPRARATISGVRLFGRMWVTTMRRWLPPMALAARTNSFSFKDRICPRRRRHTPTQPVTPMATKMLKSPAPSHDMIRMMKSSPGKADMMSTPRMMTLSTRPPAYPARAPRGTPMAKMMACTRTPTVMEISAP